MLTPDQLIAAQKANLATLNGLTNKAFEGVEKIVELNLQASKAALSESQQQAQALFAIKDAQDLLNLQAVQFQPLAEKVAAYSRHLYDIASGTSAEFNKVLEGKVSESQAQFAAFQTAENKRYGDLIRKNSGLDRVVLSGGVFQNRLLTELVYTFLAKSHFSVFIHRLVPPNDGGIALGQAAIAARR